MEFHFVFREPIDSVLIRNNASDDADLHIFRHEPADSFDLITNVEFGHLQTPSTYNALVSLFTNSPPLREFSAFRTPPARLLQHSETARATAGAPHHPSCTRLPILSISD